MKYLLVQFIKWLSNKDDIFYSFDDPEEAAEEFLKEHNL